MDFNTILNEAETTADITHNGAPLDEFLNSISGVNTFTPNFDRDVQKESDKNSPNELNNAFSSRPAYKSSGLTSFSDAPLKEQMPFYITGDKDDKLVICSGNILTKSSTDIYPPPEFNDDGDLLFPRFKSTTTSLIDGFVMMKITELSEPILVGGYPTTCSVEFEIGTPSKPEPIFIDDDGETTIVVLGEVDTKPSGHKVVNSTFNNNIVMNLSTGSAGGEIPFEVKIGVDQYDNEALTVNYGTIEMGEVSGVYPYPVNGVQAPFAILDSLIIEDGDLWMTVRWLPQDVTVDGYTRNYEVTFTIAASANDIPLAAYDQSVFKLAVITSETVDTVTVYSVESIFNKNVESRWL